MSLYIIDIWYIFIAFFLIWFAVLASRKHLTAWQHSGYNLTQYSAYIKNDFWKFFPKHIILLLLFPIIFSFDLFLLVCILSILFIAYIGVLIWIYYKVYQRNKKQLVYTAKIKKYIIILGFIIIFAITLAMYSLNILDKVQLASLMGLFDRVEELNFVANIFGLITEIFSMVCLAVVLYIILLPIEIIIASLIMRPFDSLEKKKFIKKATAKLDAYPGKKIGITGSYGKTSTKFIVADLLNYKQYTLATPNSFNTTFGVTMTIDKHLQNIHENLIVEMGAKYVKDIQEIAEFVKPEIGIITSVGQAHLETFKSQERILETKFELVENLAPNGTAILNLDDELVMSYQVKRQDVQMIYVSMDNKEADYYASDISLDSEGLKFIVNTKNGDQINVKTKLLGRHNVYNIMFAIAVAKLNNFTNLEIEQAVKFIKPITHRLELKKMYGIDAIDNAFNSNIVGATESVNVLSLHKGHKVIFTPGFVELGEKDQEIHTKFGNIIGQSSIDDVILIGINKTKDIVTGLNEVGYNVENIYVVNTFDEGIATLQQIAKKDTLVLFENDLPVDN